MAFQLFDGSDKAKFAECVLEDGKTVCGHVVGGVP